MATIPSNIPYPARDVVLAHLSDNPIVVDQLEELHYLVLSVCPKCLVELRGDDALIYVPPERQHAGQDKVLLTMWVQTKSVRMQIKTGKQEKYDPSKRVAYLTNLLQQYSILSKMAPSSP